MTRLNDPMTLNAYSEKLSSDLELAFRLWKGIDIKPNLNKAITITKNALYDKNIVCNHSLVRNLIEMLIKRGYSEDLELAEKIIEEFGFEDVSILKSYIVLLSRFPINSEQHQKLTNILTDNKNKDDMIKLWYADLLYYHDKKSEEYEDILNQLIQKKNPHAIFREQRLHYECLINPNEKELPEYLDFMIVSSNEYIKYTKVLLCSLKNTHPNQHITVHLINTYINESNRSRLFSEETELLKINLIHVNSDTFDRFNFPRGGGLWTIVCLIRLAPHLFLPRTVRTVVSLGVDTIVLGNLSELFTTEFGNNALMGTISGPDYKYHYDAGNVLTPTKYINGDFIVFNLEFFRRNNITFDSYFKCIASDSVITEEFLLPALFKNKIILLDTYKYNYRFDATHRALHKHGLLCFPPKIIQFLGYQKPWSFYLDRDEMSDDKASGLNTDWEKNNAMEKWWECATHCDHYDELYSDLKIQRNTLIIHASHIESRTLKDSSQGAPEGILARAYRDGKGVPQDLSKAAEWMRKSANKNVEWAQIELFDILWKLGNVDAYSEMISTILPLVQKGDGGAIGRLARAYRDGKGVPQDLSKAAEWMRKSANKNVEWAQIELFDILWKLGNVDAYPEMISTILPLVQKGNGKAILRLARAYRYGKGVAQNEVESINLYARAVTLKISGAEEELQDLKKSLV